MKKCLLIALLLFSGLMATGQKVDSIRVEQTGDLVKVYYKILGSSQSQVFRVSVLCSVNGGLRSVLNSLSGDYGDNVTGGRNEYMILWDVLKDVDELKSAEFFIKAELVKDLSEGTGNQSDTTRLWESRKIIVMPIVNLPGPGFGMRIGFLGSVGLSGQVYRGKLKIIDDYESNQYFTEPEPRYGVGLDVTKRIVSNNSFQMHLLAGYRNFDIMVYYAGSPTPQFWYQGVDGLEFGTIIAIKRGVIALNYSYFSPGQLKSKLDYPVTLVCPNQYFSFGMGVRF